MQTTTADTWNTIVNTIYETVEKNKNKHIRVCTSFGAKSMIVVCAAAAVSRDIGILYMDTGRQSSTLKAHFDSNIKILRDEGMTVDVHPITCTMTKEDVGKPGSKCPVMTFMKEIPKDTVDIVGSVDMVYPGTKIKDQRDPWKKNKGRVFPLWGLDLKTLFYLHQEYVPPILQFPRNSVATCNSPVCPIIPDLALKDKTDWSR